MDILKSIWETICKWYQSYSSFIHSFLPGQLGDLVEGVIDIAVACLIIYSVAKMAFGTREKK